MTDNTAIEWADSTFNPWIGCTKISPACDHCYAEAHMDTRLGRVRWGAGQPRTRTSVAYWQKPLQWEREPFYRCGCGMRGTMRDLAPHGVHDCGYRLARRRVFCASLADVFDNEVNREWRDDLATLILSTPNLDWLLLTKRIGNAGAMLGDMFLDGPPANLWLGATICNQQEADRDIPKLLNVSAAVRFLSIEPMLGPIDLRWLVTEPTGNFRTHNGKRQMELRNVGLLHWVIAGGESGPQARPSRPDWFRSLRDQCAAVGIPFLFKQWGEWVSVSEVAGPGPHFSFDDGATVRRTGKKVAGRTLDGVEHTGFPRP